MKLRIWCANIIHVNIQQFSPLSKYIIYIFATNGVIGCFVELSGPVKS